MIQAASYVTRPMEPGDIPSVAAIDRLSFPAPWPPSAYAYELKYGKDSFYYTLLCPTPGYRRPARARWQHWLHSSVGVHRDDKSIIGYLGLRQKEESLHITTIAVHPDWRHRGLGELLLLLALEKATELHSPAVTLEVRPSNTVAQSLYRKYRFRFTGIHRGYYRDGENAWLMAVDIASVPFQSRLTFLGQSLERRLLAESPHVGQDGTGTL